MSKNLENEYKMLMAGDVPDLWGRIEAELEPKQPEEKKTSLWRKYRAWGVAAAACLCLLVMAPLILGKNAEENMSSSNGAAYEAYSDVYENAAGTNANDSVEFESGEADENIVARYEIRAKVTEISEKESRTEYIVEIEEAGDTEFEQGAIIRLYDAGVLDEKLVEGEIYTFDISSVYSGVAEYFINDIKYE